MASTSTLPNDPSPPPPPPGPRTSKPRRKPGRVPTSCQECRRLKLKCDRKVPCGSCEKRGCASICPEGMTASRGNRMVLANTEELHDRIEGLKRRVRDLEEALKEKEEGHPLLVSASGRQESGVSGVSSHEPRVANASHEPSGNRTSTTALTNGTRPAPPPRLDRHSEEDSIIDAFGTLTIGSKGETSFLGKTARSEYLIHAPTRPSSLTTLSFPRLTKEIVSAAYPDAEITVDNASLASLIISLLPPPAEALALCESYLIHGSYAWSTLQREDLIDDVLKRVYAFQGAEDCCWNSVALIFAIFALGTLLSPAYPAFSIEAQEWYLLSRVTLINLTMPIHRTTEASVQIFVHLASYLELSDWESTGSAIAWSYVGLGSKLGSSIGLHLNSARWKLDEAQTQRRSHVFWQLFAQDTWLSFSFGRPPGMNAAFIDCAFPKDQDEYTNKDGQKELGFHSWTWQYSKLLHNVMTTAFGAKMPPYSIVLDLDRKIRDFPTPKYLLPNCDPNETPAPSKELIMQRWIVLSSKEATLLNLHRTYFTQALRDQPNDLLRHRYGPSVMATYRSAWRLIQGLKSPSQKTPDLLARISLAWSHALSAAIVMCLLVTRAPSSTLANSCLEELDTVERMFDSAAADSKPAFNNLESIRKLRAKGHEAVNQTHPPDALASLTPAELDRLGGKTHLIAQDSIIDRPPSLSSSNNPSPPSDVDTNAHFTFDSELMCMDNLHPRIVQDMKAFDNYDISDYNAHLQPGEFLYDLPPNTYPQAMADIQYQDASIYGNDLFVQPPMSGYQQNGLAPATNGLSPGPPVLDTTWQSFVEQLGF